MFFGHEVDVGCVKDASGHGRSTVFLRTSWLYVVLRMKQDMAGPLFFADKVEVGTVENVTRHGRTTIVLDTKWMSEVLRM